MVLYTKREGHQPSGFGEEEFYRGFKIQAMAWQPSLSHDQNRLNKLSVFRILFLGLQLFLK